MKLSGQAIFKSSEVTKAAMEERVLGDPVLPLTPQERASACPSGVWVLNTSFRQPLLPPTVGALASERTYIPSLGVRGCSRFLFLLFQTL